MDPYYTAKRELSLRKKKEREAKKLYEKMNNIK